MTKPMALTLGDPGGIGPEVLVKALSVLSREGWPPLRVFGDRTLLQSTAVQLNLPGPEQWAEVEICNPVENRVYETGRLTEAGAKAQVAWIQAALDSWERGETLGVITGPIHKQALAMCGSSFKGHTEWLETFATRQQAVMMLAGERLKVVPATVHIPLSEVPKRLSVEFLVETLEITAEGMRTVFGLSHPRIAVCGLNPHAGDGGLMGTEDDEIIAPAIRQAQEKDTNAEFSGPYPGDTVFYFAAKGEYDAVVGMYHDQALAPLKLLHFDDGINLTLGLPFLRTSVDHGTAYNIAGQGVASSRSMEEALRVCARYRGA